MQKRTARFITGSYNYETISITSILGQSKWESPKKRGKYNRRILSYKGIKYEARPHPLNSERKKSPLNGIADTDINRGSFSPQTIRDWNALSESVISSAQVADDCVLLRLLLC